jgi:hypothetical protein
MSSGFNGYLMLNKEIKRHEYLTDYKTFHLFLWLLLDANFLDANFKGIPIKRGQKMTSLNSLVIETGLTEREVRTALEKLIKSNHIIKKTTNKNTLLTVVEYEYYTGLNESKDKPTTNQRQTNDKRKTNQRQTKDKPTTTIEKYNNLNNKELKKIERVVKNLSHFDFLKLNYEAEVLELVTKYKPKINDWDSLVKKFNLKKVDKFDIGHLEIFIDNWLKNAINFKNINSKNDNQNDNNNEIPLNHPSRRKII